jgi:hypothetical protein
LLLCVSVHPQLHYTHHHCTSPTQSSLDRNRGHTHCSCKLSCLVPFSVYCLGSHSTCVLFAENLDLIISLIWTSACR